MAQDLPERLDEIARGYSACTACRELGVPSDSRRLRYRSLAESVRPNPLRVLVIAESAPAVNKRGLDSFFYLPENDLETQAPSALFWEMARVLALARACGATHDSAKAEPKRWKAKLLSEFSARGLWLLDTAKCAVNGLAEGKRRDTAVTRCASMWLKQELAVLEPERIVLIKTNVFRSVRPLLEEWGYGARVLNQGPIPHPGSGHQKEFRSLLGAIVQSNPELFGV